jgi:hypothetical protein
MSVLATCSVWGIGAFNGYSKDPFPASYKYGAMGVATGLQIVKTLAVQKLPITDPKSLVFGLFVGIPLFNAAYYCVGHFVGKSAHHAVKSHMG